MRTLILGALAMATAGPAFAQQVLGAGSPSPRAVTTLDTTVTNASVAPPASTIGRDATDSATAPERVAAERAAVQVGVGASIRVERGARCTYDDFYYDPVERDGAWYCERTGNEGRVQAGAGVRR
jgi:hypothetical protein